MATELEGSALEVIKDLRWLPTQHQTSETGKLRTCQGSPWGRRAHAHTAQAFVAGEPLGASPIPGRCSCLGPGMDKKSRDSLGPPGVRVAFGPLGAQLVFSGLGSPCPPLSLARGAAGRSPKPGVSASKCGCCYFPLECPSLLSSLSSPRGAGPPEQGERGTRGSQDNLAS